MIRRLIVRLCLTRVVRMPWHFPFSSSTWKGLQRTTGKAKYLSLKFVRWYCLIPTSAKHVQRRSWSGVWEAEPGKKATVGVCWTTHNKQRFTFPRTKMWTSEETLRKTLKWPQYTLQKESVWGDLESRARIAVRSSQQEDRQRI